ncbi:two-component system, chemotaxis family, response regulator CheV [Anaerovirgula multivorans]|uniref:Stage 0 sporulation protein A homolog n=1 Tax=Anaerovirgula multivorans TaxID=312168 RepID=A0A239DBN4_9FIRM|nr:chemotaxis protein [Anaerovirgula multivorans]SNS29775.1 two-component system, chemotaxis family, response regulator CheV [Anaerovirgula multivorans]
MNNRSKILLESGTNELEIVEFKIGENYFGINVAKVKEIIGYNNITKVPNAHPCIHGLFKPRDYVITVINLPKYLNFSSNESINKDFFLITYFNKITTAFQVNSVVGIHRLSWEEIEKPDTTIYDGIEGIVTGIVKINDRLVAILDFEKIVSDISPRTGIQISDIKTMSARQYNDKPILIAEDSQMLSQVIKECLTQAGYKNLIMVNNGREAWDILEKVKARKDKKINEIVSCVITDIEMPQIDGHHLTKLIKEDAILGTLPVIIFSSLISEEMMRKGKKLGADAQITKPEIKRLVGVVDELIEKHVC